MKDNDFVISYKDELSNKRSDWILTDEDVIKYEKELEELRQSMLLLLLPFIETQPVFVFPLGKEKLKTLRLMEGIQSVARNKFVNIDRKSYEAYTKQQRVDTAKSIIDYIIRDRIMMIQFHVNSNRAVYKNDKYLLEAYATKKFNPKNENND